MNRTQYQSGLSLPQVMELYGTEEMRGCLGVDALTTRFLSFYLVGQASTDPSSLALMHHFGPNPALRADQFPNWSRGIPFPWVFHSCRLSARSGVAPGSVSVGGRDAALLELQGGEVMSITLAGS